MMTVIDVKIQYDGLRVASSITRGTKRVSILFWLLIIIIFGKIFKEYMQI